MLSAGCSSTDWISQATLGETSETKSLNIDQPVSISTDILPVPVEIDPPETADPVPFAEIDTDVFDDDSPVEEPPARPATGEYASPMFRKRSRASYGPLFELDLDDELEDDGGRRGKGRKRPRYSVQNRTWRFREASSSPEPDVSEGSPSATPARNGDVEMKDTPARTDAMERPRQTNESGSESAPMPSTSFKTPAGSWNFADAPPSVGTGLQQPSVSANAETGTSAFPSRSTASASSHDQEIATAQKTSNPFGMVSTGPSSGFPQVKSSVHSSFGMPQNPAPTVSQAFGHTSSLFGTPPNDASTQGLGQAPSPFGPTSNGPPNQVFGQTLSLFGTAPPTTTSTFPNATSENQSKQELGKASSLFGAASNEASNQIFGQASSLFGTGPAPTPSGFGPPSSSLRFSIGQEPHNAFGAPAVAPPQPLMQQYDAHSYPESYFNRGETSNNASFVAQHSSSTHSHPFHYDHASGADDGHKVLNQSSSEQRGTHWLSGPQSVNPDHANVGFGAAGDSRPEENGPQATPLGMIPPQVEDGSRNADEMQREGLLSQPVFRQDVPQAALPGEEDASVSEDAESLGSDDQAYDENEKGDDYDLRNYDRVSDDEEGFDEETPLPDDELLGEDEDQFEGEEADFEDDDYDEDEDDGEEDEEDGHERPYERPGPYPPAPQWLAHPPPQPTQTPVQKQPIVIDLLSDSDDDELPAVQGPQDQSRQQETDEFAKTEPEDQAGHPGQESQSFAAYEQQENFRSEQDEDSDEVMVDNPDDGAEESLADDAQDSNEDELDGSQERDDGPHGYNSREDRSSVRDETLIISTINSVAEVEEASTASPGQIHDSAESFSEEIIEEEVHAEVTAVSKGHEILRQVDDAEDATDLDEERHHDLVGSFQSQPAEILASFETRVTAATDRSSPQEYHTSHSYGDGDINAERIKADVDREAPDFASRVGSADEGPDDHLASRKADDVTELSDEDSGEDAEGETGAAAEGKVPKMMEAEYLESKRLHEPSSPPESQNQDFHVEPIVNVPMTTVTTVTSHNETQFSDEQEIVYETRDAEVILKQSAGSVDDHSSAAHATDAEMVDVGATDEAEGSSELVEDAQLPQPPYEHKDHEVQDSGLPQAQPMPAENINNSLLSPRDEAQPEMDDPSVNKRRSISAEIDAAHSQGEEDFQPEDAESHSKSSPDLAQGTDASFATVDSQGSDAQENENAEMTPQGKPKRVGKKPRATSKAQSAKSATVSKRAQRQPSSQQAPSSQRTTRSKTMSSHQAASPREDDEDMSIQLARAAMKSPSMPSAKAPAKTKRKVSAVSAKRIATGLSKRLDSDMPDCVPLKELRKYNSRALDVAAVATSAHTAPKRTATREYASSFTITDPSLAPDGTVAEVSLYSLHREHLPVVRAGDAVLLRSFTVVSLPGRGFGLKSDKDDSSWAVFEADGEAEPQTRAAPVEMNEKETKYMHDLRAWYAVLDDGTREKLGKAVKDLIESGRESRAKN